MNRTWIAMVVGTLLTVTACAGEAPAIPPGPDGTVDDALVLGREVYQRRCANCHGADGGGGTGPELAGGAVVAAFPDPETQMDLLANGRNGMPAFAGRLTADELTAVVRYTREVLG